MTNVTELFLLEFVEVARRQGCSIDRYDNQMDLEEPISVVFTVGDSFNMICCSGLTYLLVNEADFDNIIASYTKIGLPEIKTVIENFLAFLPPHFATAPYSEIEMELEDFTEDEQNYKTLGEVTSSYFGLIPDNKLHRLVENYIKKEKIFEGEKGTKSLKEINERLRPEPLESNYDYVPVPKASSSENKQNFTEKFDLLLAKYIDQEKGMNKKKRETLITQLKEAILRVILESAESLEWHEIFIDAEIEERGTEVRPLFARSIIAIGFCKIDGEWIDYDLELPRDFEDLFHLLYNTCEMEWGTCRLQLKPDGSNEWKFIAGPPKRLNRMPETEVDAIIEEKLKAAKSNC